MSIETTIRQLWAADATLAARVPVDRVTIGNPIEPRTPCAVLRVVASTSDLKTNTGEAFDRVEFEIVLWHADHDNQRATVAETRRVLDGAGTDDANEGVRRVVRFERETAPRQDNGIWLATLRFAATVRPTTA